MGATRPGHPPRCPAMPDDRDPMDVEGSLEKLNAALTLQYRSALSYTLVAGSLTGFEFQAFSHELTRFAHEEIDDARHLVEKIAALEGQPTDAVAELRFEPDPERALERLIEQETEAIEALQELGRASCRERV